MKYVNKKLGEFESYIENKNIAIIGLGISNTPLIEYLYNLGANITIFNNKPIETNLFERFSNKIKFSCGDNYLSKLHGFDIIFRSPTCRPDLPEIQKEINNHYCILTSEIELLLELCPGTIIGITGSDGKTTTSTLIYKILNENGLHCYLGGNIGLPLFTQIGEMTPSDYIVLELSSFQLMSIKKSPHIAVITNISPNHLDIHKSYVEYIEAKSNIFKYQTEDDLLVLNYDNDITRKFSKKAKGKVMFFSKNTNLDNGVILENNIIKFCDEGLKRHIIAKKDLKLRGLHNIENICASIAATSKISTVENQFKTISKFREIEHRLEFIKKLDGVSWFNDSIASSPTRTMAGLNSFDENITLIAGGYDKHLDYEPLAKPILAKVNNLILLGQTSNKINDVVTRNSNVENKKINIYKTNTLEEAINKAREVSHRGDVVLFSPASASFDMFKNFEERGEVFKKLVNKLH